MSHAGFLGRSFLGVQELNTIAFHAAWRQADSPPVVDIRAVRNYGRVAFFFCQVPSSEAFPLLEVSSRTSFFLKTPVPRSIAAMTGSSSQSADGLSFTGSPATTSATYSPPAVPTTPSVATTTSTPPLPYGSTGLSNPGNLGSGSNSNSSSHGTSPGVYAGIAIGGVVGGALIAFLLTWMTMRSKRHQRRHQRSSAHRYLDKDLATVTVTEVPTELTEGYRWEKHLPQPVDDSSLRLSMKTLFHQVELHVENFYSDNEGRGRPFTPDGQMRMKHFDTEHLPGPIATLMQQTSVPTAVIKHCLMKQIVSSTSATGPAQTSFLPAGYNILSMATRHALTANKQGERLSLLPFQRECSCVTNC